MARGHGARPVNSQAFNAASGPILVNAEITGPLGTAFQKLVLDTGATTSLINVATLLSLGLDSDQSAGHIRMTTGSAIETVPLVVLTHLTALGEHRFGFPVIAHALPSGSAVDGLLGLDFVRGHVLT